MRIIHRVCDRCKKDIVEWPDPEGEGYHIYQYVHSLPSSQEDEEEHGYKLDLCRECRKSFKDWLDNNQKESCEKCLYAEETDGSHCYKCVKDESKFEPQENEDKE